MKVFLDFISQIFLMIKAFFGIEGQAPEKTADQCVVEPSPLITTSGVEALPATGAGQTILGAIPVGFEMSAGAQSGLEDSTLGLSVRSSQAPPVPGWLENRSASTTYSNLTPPRTAITSQVEKLPDTITRFDLSGAASSNYTKLQVTDSSGNLVISNPFVPGNMRNPSGGQIDDLVLGSPSQNVIYVIYGKVGGLGNLVTANPSFSVVSNSNPSINFPGEKILPPSGLTPPISGFGSQFFEIDIERTLSGTSGTYGRFMVTDATGANGFTITGRDSPPSPVTGFFIPNVLPIVNFSQVGGLSTLPQENIKNTFLSNSTGSVGDVNRDGYEDVLFRDKDPALTTAFLVYGNRVNTFFNTSTVESVIGSNPTTLITAFTNLDTMGHHKQIAVVNNIRGDSVYVAITSPAENKITLMKGDNLPGRTIDTDKIPAELIVSVITSDGGNGITGAYAISDKNGDGLDDIAITTSNGVSGSVFILYGSAQLLMGSINIDHLSPLQGYKITGAPVDSIILPARDVNGDVMSDFIITSPGAKEHILVYGSNTALNVLSGSGNLSADSVHDILHGGVNNDTLDQNGVAKTLLAGGGNDKIVIDNPGILTKVDGGLGQNTLVLDPGVRIDFSLLKSDVFVNIQKIELTSNNDVTLRLEDILELNKISSGLPSPVSGGGFLNRSLIVDQAPNGDGNHVTIKLEDNVQYSKIVGGGIYDQYNFSFDNVSQPPFASLIVDSGVTVDVH